MLPLKFQPIRLSRRAEPFDSSDFIYEIKHDGFRAIACIQAGECQLVSRNGNIFRGFKELAEWIGRRLRVDAILDGEIVALDRYGRSQFNDLLFRRGVLFFYAFDLISLNGEDLRSLRLVERKARLRKLIRRGRSHLLYVDYIEQNGSEFFRRICELDLEGIVAKRAASKYRVTEQPSRDWIKIKNPNYTQKEGRAELFDELQGRAFAKAAKRVPESRVTLDL
jgi:bifunctional non-homologous end joining protein LigD